MPKVTRIKARDGKSDKADKSDGNKANKAKISKKDKKANKKPAPKFLRILAAPFILISKPFRSLGRYIKASWQEIRQVRWPDRKSTWQMTFSVIAYVILMATIIMLLDLLFSFIFNKLLGV